MPVRIVPSTNTANPIRHGFAKKDIDILNETCRYTRGQELNVIQSGFRAHHDSTPVIPVEHGLVWSVIKAYNTHHHLILSADDIWFAVLTQMSIYINAHAEELREKFVKHEGQMNLVIEYNTSRTGINFSHFAEHMVKLMDVNIVDPEFKDWIMPNFSTTTSSDKVVASIIMMGTMQKYFRYGAMSLCGLPSVTLLGMKSDYEDILHRLDKLPTFGSEPAQFAELLRPVIKRFIRSFDDPTDATIVDFWQRIVDVRRHGSGSPSYTGWITAFCFWNEVGRCLYNPPPPQQVDKDGHATSSRKNERLVLDDASYHVVSGTQLPRGWIKVPITIDDGGEKLETEMVAGSIGILCSSSGAEDENGVPVLDTMEPEVRWWVYEKLNKPI